MIKELMKWAGAVVAMVALSAGSAYLAFEASPHPMVIVDVVEKPVEVVVTKTVEVGPHAYDASMYILLILTEDEEGNPIIMIMEVDEIDYLPYGALYLLQIDYDIDPNSIGMEAVFILEMPDGYQPIAVPFFIPEASSIRTSYIAGLDIPKSDSNEDEF